MRIILASQSPRRKYLLEQMGLRFEQIPSSFEEYFDDTRPVEEVVKELALGKALDVAKNNHDAVVIGSDLIVVIDGKQIGKPESAEEAKQMLRNISGRAHQLICSVAIVCFDKNYQRVEVETAEVTFDTIPEHIIDEYVATGTTYDKASGYAIQHPLIKPYILEIKGRLDTIIGLPTNLVSQLLSEHGINAKEVNLDSKDKDIAKALFE
ncbi:septum formation protein Maf [Candidatus Saccharibacteria bacterium]|nr:septum formation protein Maf [Candidatus Saccharibacteria bacterium]